jgi:hypothetical protein
MIFHMARVAPEKQFHHLPATVFLVMFKGWIMLFILPPAIETLVFINQGNSISITQHETEDGDCIVITREQAKPLAARLIRLAEDDSLWPSISQQAAPITK